MSQTSRRHSSEYSAHSEQSKEKAAIQISEEEQEEAKGHLYSLMFSFWSAKLAIIPSFISGAGPVLIFYIFGKILNRLSVWAFEKLSLPASSVVDPLSDIIKYCIWMGVIALGLGIAKFFDIFSWIRIGSLISTHIRRELFLNMMKSEVTFFDVNPIGSILTLLSEDAQLVQEAFGTTKGTQISNFAQFITGIFLAYFYSWKLALIATLTFPVIAILICLFMPAIEEHSTIRFSFLSKSITIAEETISYIRTVRGFNRETFEVSRFRKETYQAADHEKSIGYLMTIMMTLVICLIWGMILGNLYYGATLVEDSLASDRSFMVGDLMSVFGFCMFGCFGVMMLQGSMQGEQKAIAAGARIIKLSKHQPSINFEGGLIPNEFHGNIEFRNVTFRYPTRPADVLKNLSFKINAGQIAALVGHSGSGKSTCVQLLERFYDVTDGIILIDDHDIREYDPRWLHQKIGLVSQEPTLFSTTLKNNIIYGYRDASDEEINHALEVAYAKKFIDRFEKKLETQVGEKGASLSGGQRQRIAIARAILKNPTIMITDEATSALDADSEKKVQLALDQVLQSRTGVIVAHRLSTIRNAHIIYVFDDGHIVESGTHEELLSLGQVYYNLISRQLTSAESIKPNYDNPSNNSE